MSKKKKTVVVKKSFSSINMSINGAEFHAEGDSAEVSAKLNEWLKDALRPIIAMRELAEKTFKP